MSYDGMRIIRTRGGSVLTEHDGVRDDPELSDEEWRVLNAVEAARKQFQFTDIGRRFFALRDFFVAKGLDRTQQIQALRIFKSTKTEGSAMTDRSFKGLALANARRQLEWDPNNKVTLVYRGNELAGEVGELCNILKKLERERLGIKGSRATKEEAINELADVIICASLIANDLDFDLWQAVVRKFNATSERVGLTTRLSADGGVTQ